MTEDKNREIAWEELKRLGLTEDEWAQFEHVAELSEGLVPLEQAAMNHVMNGDTDSAIDCVFGEEYERVVDEIDGTINEAIEKIQRRLANRCSVARVIEFISMFLFLSGFVFMALQILRVIKFSKEELLKPILLISGQMEALGHADFSQKLDM